jgi:hypothetical protein
MRAVLVLLLASCNVSPSGTDPIGDFSGDCSSDAVCRGGEVCARSGGCYPPSQIRSIQVTWTLDGQAASAETCGASQDLEIDFHGSDGGSLGFAPVPCVAGKFSIDKLPVSFTSVRLGTRGHWASGELDHVTGEAALDLSF